MENVGGRSTKVTSVCQWLAAAPGQRIEVEDQLLSVDHRQRRVTLGQRPETPGEVDLLAGAEVLPADEDHPVGQHGGSQFGDLLIGGGAQIDLDSSAPIRPVSRRTVIDVAAVCREPCATSRDSCE